MWLHAHLLRLKIARDLQSAATGQTSSPGYSPTGTGAGYGATSAGTGYNAQNLSGSTGPSSGYSNQAQPGYDTQPTGQGYAPAQAKTGSATDGTYGATAAVSPVCLLANVCHAPTFCRTLKLPGQGSLAIPSFLAYAIIDIKTERYDKQLA